MSEELQSEITQEFASEDQAPPLQAESTMPAPQLGALLIEAREQCDLSAADVARQLRLGLRQVQALEENRFDDLPGNTFVRGFIRNYARAVNTDAAPLLAAYEQIRPQQAQVEMTRPSEGIAFPSKGTPKWVWYAGGFVLLLILSPLVIFLLLQDDGSVPAPRKKAPAASSSPSVAAATPHAPLELPMPQAVPQNTVPELANSTAQTASPNASTENPIPPTVSAVATPTASVSAVPSPKQAPAVAAVPTLTASVAASPAVTPSTGKPANAPETNKETKTKPGEAQLALRFEGDAWVEIRDRAGAIVFSKLNRRGETQLVQGKPPFNVVVGNAAQVRITYNDKPIDLAQHTKINVARFKLE